MNYQCGCGKDEHVAGPNLTPADATAIVIGRGWVSHGSMLSCSPECHNRSEESRYESWREGGGYALWWGYSPYGRAKYGCEPPACNCDRCWDTVEHPTRGTIRLLDYRHEDDCWWSHEAVSAPHPEGKPILPKVCYECGEPAEFYVEEAKPVKGSALNYTRFLFYCRPCRGPFTLTSKPLTATYEQ